MTLIVENGTGLANAESYISVADADARHAAFGNDTWTGTDAVKEAALRRATAYMEQTYRQRWKGTRLKRDQALSWPRYGAQVDGFDVSSIVVPLEVINACADLALRAITADLSEDQGRVIIREKVGPLETEYSEFGPQGTRFTAVDGLLGAYLKGGGASVSLVRA